MLSGQMKWCVQPRYLLLTVSLYTHTHMYMILTIKRCNDFDVQYRTMKMTAGVSLRAKLAMVLHQRHANKKQHTFDDLVWNGQWAMVMGYGQWSSDGNGVYGFE